MELLLNNKVTDVAFTEKNFENLFKTHYHLVFNTINRLLRNVKLSELLTQDVFSEIFNEKEELLIQNYSDDFFIKKSILRVHTHLSSSHHGNVNSSWITIEQLEMQHMIFAIIDQLPDDVRQLFLLSRQSKLSNQSIAKKLNIPLALVEKRIAFALKSIHEAIYTKKALFTSDISVA